MILKQRRNSKQKPRSLSDPRTGYLAVGGSILFTIFVLALIQLMNSRLEGVSLEPDQGATWYYWKLATPTFWTQLTAWGGYFLHQLFMWGTIAYARKYSASYTKGLHKINLIALIGNAAFIGLHFLQTQLWYDGLAQNTSLTSSEASVILLLVIVLLMENKRRGLFFGKKVPISTAVIEFFRNYHGYIFVWAIVYTFWFHPMVATSGHLMGFLYIFMLMVQGSLFYTRLHLNRWWTVLLELMVLIHGAIVVYMLGSNALWAFVLGFLGIFLITQMYGLKVKQWVSYGVICLYLTAIILAFIFDSGRIIRNIVLVPLIEYGLVFTLAGLVWVGIAVFSRVFPNRSHE